MAHSFHHLLAHVIFSTHKREALIDALKSETWPLGFASVNVATEPLNDVPAIAVKFTGLAVSGASATLMSNGVVWAKPSLFFQLINPW